ncbi:pyrroloquinoline quinone biosynthesis protein PqqD [Streptomyces fodineus]|uniref:Pyrroloquinoline quinone biosynthesis protein PqqD n=1 Tax=Streptomyces fodineus TaxID=1904616 RepID=A0A1D7YKD2_9ACTN|nr:pyrroloquinoline quinone biosynthesis peptide chaperone PqqD [Streptomyces fodineus]AOR36063.1 pyrroloquinoline quinone biosynthesis protein PqqD [Streptomyces fodineus]
MNGAPARCWRLRRGVRLGHDPVRRTPVLLHPEGVLLLNETAAAILRVCQDTAGAAEIEDVLAERYDTVDTEEVEAFLAALAARHLLEPVTSAQTSAPGGAGPESGRHCGG